MKLFACDIVNVQVARQIVGIRSLGVTELPADASNSEIEVAEIESHKEGGTYP
jgi:hypothetical protein